MDITLEKSQLKELIKESFVELLSERKEEFRLLIVDALEEIGMVQAIEEGLKTPRVDREEALSWIKSRL